MGSPSKINSQWVRSSLRLLALLPVLWGLAQSARADTIQVTLTGQVYFTFDHTFGGPSFYGIEPGDLFSSVLTYDSAQANLGTVQGQGQYGVYDYTVTVQTAGGPVTLGGPISWPCNGCANDPLSVYKDFNTGSAIVDSVNNAGSFVSFIFEGYNLLTDDALNDVNWQDVLAASIASQGTFRSPIAVPVQGGLDDMFLRAPNAAVVVEGEINQVDVVDIPVPEPSPGILLLGSILVSFAAVLLSRMAKTSVGLRSAG